MKTFAKYFIFLFLGLTCLDKITGLSDKNMIFESFRLPTADILPTLSNGNLGFTVTGEIVHVNGVYNGKAGNSRRAKVPNFGNLQQSHCTQSNEDPQENCLFRLNIKSGMFETIYTAAKSQYSVTHQVYPHKIYDKSIINHFRIQRLSSTEIIRSNILQLVSAEVEEDDFVFEPTEFFEWNGNKIASKCGKTKALENDKYQKDAHEICIMYEEIPIQIICANDKTADEYTFVTTIAKSKTEAFTEITKLLEQMQSSEIGTLKANIIRNQHIAEMERTWKIMGISVEGNDELDRVLHASAFYLTSSLPSLSSSSKPFYGLSPSGLGKGGNVGEDYQGHSLWDSEIWMLPVTLLMHAPWAKQLLEYRFSVSKAAAERATASGHKGWKFPRESGYTGVDVSNDVSEDAAENQLHITADIAFAAKLYFIATYDNYWFRQHGCRLAYETAKFWESRLDYNNETDTYDIKGVMGPDEDHEDVSNNVFTNVMAANNMFFGEFAGCYCSDLLGIANNEHRQLVDAARSITLLYNSTHKYYPQYEGYIEGTAIKQADAVLLGYPLEYPMDKETKSNNLKLYASATRENGPAITWSMHTIGHLDINETDEAATVFLKSYKEYIRPPFYVWSEFKNGITNAAGNYITGAGGFLQSIIYGYAGIRIRNDYLEIKSPTLPPGTTALHLPQLTFLKVKFQLNIHSGDFNITINNIDDQLTLVIDGTEKTICSGCTYIAKNEILLKHNYTYANENCELKDTILGIKTKNSGGHFKVQLLLLLCSTIMLILNVL